MSEESEDLYPLFAEVVESSRRGPQGIPGIQGEIGTKGDKGDVGEQGLQGIQGIPGEKGDKGDTGDQGAQGLQGDQGLKGDRGDRGDTGEQGIPGEKGDKGDTGDQGAQGLQGDQGLKGDRGDRGDTGEQGIPGEKGDKGDTGDQGVPGAGIPISSTSKYYVDGTIGNDSTADGTTGKPFKIIQACLNFIGQPTTMEDALRHISIYIADSHSSSIGNNAGANQSWDGVYKENLVVPSRMITMYGAGVKIGNNVFNVDNGFGNILKEYSAARRFGASSSDLRPCLTMIGSMNCRDSHNRLRNGLHIGGYCRTSVLARNIDSIQGNGSNKVTVHITTGQNPYVISINPNYPTEPLIRIKVNNTTNYNYTYDITAKINDTTFEATRVSGTNTHTETETGSFFESDSSGASSITHDAAFINCYMQGAYSSDDGTANGAAITAGTDVLYLVNTKLFTGIEGRNTLIQRAEDATFAGAMVVSSFAGVNNCSFAGTITTNTFTYSTDDMGWMNNRFNSAVPITVSTAGQTVRMDAVTLNSFLNAGCTWVTNTPTIDYLDQDRAIKNSSAYTGATIKDALATIKVLTDSINAGGITSTRPSSPILYCNFFDMTLGKPIWWNGTAWKDATGATV
jgi:hypothetical protein